jgi:integrase
MKPKPALNAPVAAEAKWSKTKTPNLIRYKASGVYFMRAKVGGKLYRESLDTDVYETATIRLADRLSEKRKAAKSVEKVHNGKMTFGDALRVYRTKLTADVSLKPRGREYREETIDFLLRNWPGICDLDIKKISERRCLEWSAGFAKKYSASVYNNTVGTLRFVFDVAIDAGAIYTNPAKKIKKKKVVQKRLQLPSQQHFPLLVDSVRHAGSRFSRGCADLIEFLAYGGMRKTEASRVVGADCDFKKGRIRVLGDPVFGTKNWEVRNVPMIPEMRALLERIKSERDPETWGKSPVMSVSECQKAIESAIGRLANPEEDENGVTPEPIEIARITHHDLRHLFATRCIESGVDIPTVSRWLGHKDGGALAMKTYGHLRDDHSTEMAAKVRFAPATQPDNVVPMVDKAA